MKPRALLLYSYHIAFAHADELRKMGLEIPQCTELMGKLADAGLNVDRNCLTIDEAVNSILKAALSS